jgi:hypothetical protein
MASPASRQLFILFGGFVGGFVVHMLIRAMATAQVYISRSYLLVVSFVHVLTFWQVATISFFIILSYDAKVLPTIAVLAALTYLLGRGSILDHGLLKSSLRLVLTTLVLTIVEIALALSLLPIHHYTLATILTAWYFFIVEMVVAGQELTSRKSIFKRYSTLLFIGIALLLVTTTWQ